MSQEAMRAAFYRRTGPAPDVLEVGTLPTPVPKAGEVRVRLAASGVNPTDVKSRAGLRGGMAFPCQVPGQDGAGEIDAVGEGVDPGRLGQRVWVFHAALNRPGGTAARAVAVPAWQAVPLGDLPMEFGAALGIPFITAHRCLLRDGEIEGETVLIAGGAGAVGNAAIQLARRHGARTIATVSTEQKAARAYAAGAEHVVIDYRRPNAADEIRSFAPDGIDRILELAPATNLELDLAILRNHGRIVVYGAEPVDPVIPVAQMMYRGHGLDFFLVYLEPRAALEEAARDISVAAAAGELTMLPVRRFPLDQAAEAHLAVEAGADGRVMIDIPSDLPDTVKGEGRST